MAKPTATLLERLAVTGTLLLGALAATPSTAHAQFANAETNLRAPPPTAPRFTRYWRAGEYTSWRNRVERWCGSVQTYVAENAANTSAQRTEMQIPDQWYTVLAQLERRKHIGLGTLTKPELIVVHMTEGELCPGVKKMWLNANAHLVVDRDGTTYRLLADTLVADHAGRSYWDGAYGVSRRSLAIELVGFNKDGPTSEQYEATKHIIHEWQERYGLGDEHVVAHYQVAAEPRLKNGRRATTQQLDDFQAGTLQTPHTIVRERRTDGTSFVWERFGVERTEYDPDVASGNVTPSKTVTKLLLDKIDSTYSLRDAIDEAIGRIACGLPLEIRIGGSADEHGPAVPSVNELAFEERQTLLYQGKNTRVVCK